MKHLHSMIQIIDDIHAMIFPQRHSPRCSKFTRPATDRTPDLKALARSIKTLQAIVPVLADQNASVGAEIEIVRIFELAGATARSAKRGEKLAIA